jgi:hypothetical protein
LQGSGREVGQGVVWEVGGGGYRSGAACRDRVGVGWIVGSGVVSTVRIVGRAVERCVSRGWIRDGLGSRTWNGADRHVGVGADRHVGVGGDRYVGAGWARVGRACRGGVGE